MSIKIFPGIKKFFSRIRRKTEAPKAVYAGPEYFRKKHGPRMEKVYAGPVKDNSDPAPAECVYAGPEYFGRPEPPVEKPVYAGPEPDDTVMEDVYAGPEFFGEPDEPCDTEEEPDSGDEKAVGSDNADASAGEKTFGFVYGGPVRRDTNEFMTVYAGPGFFGGQEKKSEDKDETFGSGGEGPGEDPAASDDKPSGPPPVAGVYAGPDPAAFMMAYAGPQFYNNNGAVAGGFVAQQQKTEPEKDVKSENPETGAVYCPTCGNPVPEGSKFCPECGSVLKNDKGNS